MPSTLGQSAVAHIAKPLLRYAKLFRIERTDGDILRFADHDLPIDFNGFTYAPALFGASATDQTTGFDSNNLELRGALDSAAIKEEELRAGLYRGARLTIYVVDWMYPFTGYIRKERYIIESTRWTGDVFEAQIAGLTAPLNKPVGRAISRDCDVEKVGDTRCGVDIELFRVVCTVDVVDTERHQFQMTIDTHTTDSLGYVDANEFAIFDNDGLYDFGEIIWTSGLNNEIVSEVKSYVKTNGVIALQIRTPYAIVATDTFTMTPGCGRVREDCLGNAVGDNDLNKRKPWINNMARFRGFPDMPGTVVVLKTPDAE